MFVGWNKCKILFYSIVGDRPALMGVLEIIGHNGYIKGIDIGGLGGKRQYYHQCDTPMWEKNSNLLESIQAAENSSNVFGHLGQSICNEVLNVALPCLIVADYLHVGLLWHTKVMVQQIYSTLLPSEQFKFRNALRTQKFPHHFNRKLRGVNDFSFMK
jgi:hypothetical protein